MTEPYRIALHLSGARRRLGDMEVELDRLVGEAMNAGLFIEAASVERIATKDVIAGSPLDELLRSES